MLTRFGVKRSCWFGELLQATSKFKKKDEVKKYLTKLLPTSLDKILATFRNKGDVNFKSESLLFMRLFKNKDQSVLL